MKYFDWDKKKNQQLKSERDISFEDVLLAIDDGQLLEIISKKIFVVSVNDYVYLVPFVEDGQKIFLKTIIPSRKATKKYLVEKEGE